MASGGSENTSDEIFNFKCTPCAKKNRNREAVKYCVECQGYCCRSCVDIHEDFPTLEGHQLLDKSDFKSAGITSDLPEVPTARCIVHPVKVMDMYCGNHDVVGCTSCMALDHRSCTDVNLIPDVIGTKYDKADVETTSRKVSEHIENLSKIVNTHASHLKELKKSKTEAINEIRAFKKEMDIILQNLETESINEVKEEYQKQQDSLEKEMRMAENEIESLKKADTDMHQSDANKAETFVNMKIVQQKIKHADDLRIRQLCDAKVIFKVDANTANMLRQLKAFGKVSFRSSTVVEQRTTIYSIKGKISDMNIRLPNDKNVCHVLGLCLTDTGVLLLTDYKNKKLKRVHITNMYEIDQCDFPNSPFFVCATGKEEAAVTFYNSTIQFVSLGKQMTRTHQLDMGHRCLGIAFNEKKLYITDYSHSLYIHDMTGTLLQTLSQDSSENHLFGNSRQVAISDNGDKILVVDWTNRMITLDNEGKHIKTFSYSDLAIASGICTDGRGNAFVCGYGSNNIIQIGQDGKEIGVISTASRPYSVCFDQKKMKLYVSQSESDQLKVITLQ